MLFYHHYYLDYLDFGLYIFKRSRNASLKNIQEFQRGNMNDKLIFKTPAKRWLEALPLGNGHIGAMIYGGAKKEKINLHDDTLYAGKKCHVTRRLQRNISKRYNRFF